MWCFRNGIISNYLIIFINIYFLYKKQLINNIMFLNLILNCKVLQIKN